MGSGPGNKPSHGGHGYMTRPEPIATVLLDTAPTRGRSDQQFKKVKELSSEEGKKAKKLKEEGAIAAGRKDRDKVKGLGGKGDSRNTGSHPIGI